MLTILSMTRQHAAPCDHWVIVVKNDVTAETAAFTSDRNAFANERFDDQRWWVRVALLWLRQKLRSGATPAQVVSVEIITVATMTALLSET